MCIRDRVKIAAMLERRRPFYLQADYIVDSDDKSPLEIAREIINVLQRCGQVKLD